MSLSAIRNGLLAGLALIWLMPAHETQAYDSPQSTNKNTPSGFTEYHKATASRMAYDQCIMNSLKENDDERTMNDKCKPAMDTFCLEMGFRPDGALMNILQDKSLPDKCINLNIIEYQKIIRLHGTPVQKMALLGGDAQAPEEVAIDATISQQAAQRDHILFAHSLPDEIPVTVTEKENGRIDTTKLLPLDDNYYVDPKTTDKLHLDWDACIDNAFNSGSYNNESDVGRTAYKLIFACHSQASFYMSQCLTNGGYPALCNHMLENLMVVMTKNLRNSNAPIKQEADEKRNYPMCTDTKLIGFLVNPGIIPSEKCLYSYPIGDFPLQALQVMSDGILVKLGIAIGAPDRVLFLYNDNKLENNLVDDSIIAPGYFAFMGKYQYTGILGQERSVYSFRRIIDPVLESSTKTQQSNQLTTTIAPAPEENPITFAEAPVTDCDFKAAFNLTIDQKTINVPFDKIDSKSAIPACQKAIQKYPNSNRLLFELGRSYLKGENIIQGMPSNVGDCTLTKLSTKQTRLDATPDSGSAVILENGIYQVSYDTIDAIEKSVVGDPIKVCLVDIPKNCPPEDNRGKTYSTLNIKTGDIWVLPDSEHQCGGA